MQVFELSINHNISDGAGMALVAAPSYEEALREYMANGDWGHLAACGEVSFSDTSKIPIAGLHYDGDTQILCDRFVYA